MSHADFLVEIRTEELPPKALRRLEKAFLQEIETRLKSANLSFTETHSFATPRRFAVFVKDLQTQQSDSVVERKGPAIEAAFDKDGKPTPACAGFARSCGVTPEQLTTIKNEAGAWVGIQQKISGKKAAELLPAIVQQSLAALPIPKRMRWGNNTAEFVRPAHSVIMLLGNDVIDAEILNCKTGRHTLGHRFHSKDLIEIKKPSDYAAILEKKGHVIADFDQRKNLIREQIKTIATKQLPKNANVVIDENLLDEVTGIVEWPVAICGNFDTRFLTVPQEALVSAMQDHQRYFPVVDENGKLLSQFIAISNIESKNPAQVVAGNERVLRARLSDAAFFFETDKKIPLTSRVENLKNVVFQAKLGSMHDKAVRLANLAAYLANVVDADQATARQAGMLAKTDLTTELVGEFPELQGIAGYYYALHDGEKTETAAALKEQYMPRFSGDKLPATKLGYVLALADRIDTLIGVFGINQQPTGDKDPFGLRRAALGLLRISIENKLHLNLREVFEFAKNNYAVTLENKNLVDEVLNFTFERLKPWYAEQGISTDVFAAVAALNNTDPYDMHNRIQAVHTFKKLAAAESLSVANKRVSNILAKYDDKIALTDIDEKLFETDAESNLAMNIKNQQKSIEALSKSGQYQELLSQLAELREPVDTFFDKVLVMTEDKPRRENRLLLLKKLRGLFLHVADIALLQ